MRVGVPGADTVIDFYTSRPRQSVCCHIDDPTVLSTSLDGELGLNPGDTMRGDEEKLEV